MRSDGLVVESGTITTACDHFRMIVPENYMPLTFVFCTIDKVPFTAIVGMGLVVYKIDEPEIT